MSTLIKGGRIITAADDYPGDVLVEDGTISLIGADLELAADTVVDAAGKYVIPGAIDPHTHIEMPFGGTVTCDDFTSGTVSAAFGGTTTLVDFCLQLPGESFAQALENWHEKLDRCKPVIDVGFHIAITDLKDGGSLETLAKVPAEGVTSYKVFMAYKGAVMVDDEALFQVMRVAADTGALVMVHAENGDAIDILVKEALANGNTEPVWHARTRPAVTEGEATNRAIQLAHVAGAPLYVVHVSCREAIEPVARARDAAGDAGGGTSPP
ncbi:MAG: amidohydrolase family protein, partial [Gaiellales bacterium]